MKSSFFSILIVCQFFCLQAQTSLSGTPNVYGPLFAQDECSNQIIIGNATDFVPGMGIIIIQTQGANIDLSDSQNYGTVTALNGAGFYEYNRITNILGNALRLEFSLANTYDPAHTQVIGFQIHEDVSVDGTVTPIPWNGITGGVVVIEATGTITLNADVDASGSGFRGGMPLSINNNNCTFLTNANDYAYAANDWRGSPKGEGIGFAASDSPHGRGAQANGGGGGNDHNSGGGGGGLLTPGGAGGTNNEPSTFGCDGDFPGRGGKSVGLDLGLLFFGGGGGSGHANNSNPSGGGSGGGIIIVKANSVVFNGGQLISNGTSATNTSGDGGGGGGSGGTIVLIADSFSGPSSIMVLGGNGATTSNGNDDRCFGPGGGGSGGVFFSSELITADLNGGAAGMSINSTSCPEGTNGAEAGMNGLGGLLQELVQGATFEIPSILSQNLDTIVCENELATLTVEVSGSSLELQWQGLIGGNWEDLTEVPGVLTGTMSSSLEVLAGPLTEGQYRLLVQSQGDCFAPLTSAPIQLTVAPAATANPSFSLNGNTATFMGNITNADQIQWTFVPGAESSEADPEFTFPGPGSYLVELLISNACGENSYTLTVEIIEPLVASISASSLAGCAPFTAIFTDESEGNVESRLWTFEGGDPMTSTSTSPVVTFSEVGTYEVSLEISNTSTNATATVTVEVAPPPVPSFNITSNELTISLENNSTNASSYLWDFGDDNTSTEVNPTHTYTTPGTYDVSLNASNELCGVATVQTVTVMTTSVAELDIDQLRVFPNPTDGLLRVENWTKGQVSLFTLQGSLIRSWTKPKTELNVADLPAGTYLLVLPGTSQTYQKLIIY